MNNRRKLVVALGAGSLPVAFASLAQQQARIRRIGLLAVGSASFMASRVGRLKTGLQELGYIEGKNVAFEWRYADGKNERLAPLAAELAGLQVDILVTHTTLGVQAATQATSSIPIVMASTADAVAAGLITSLARPGGNVTGCVIFTPEIMAKRIELLKEVAPQIKRVAAFLRLSAASVPIKQALETAAKSLKIQIEAFEAPGVGEADGRFSTMIKAGIDGLVIQDDPVIISNAKVIAGLAEKHRIPSSGNAEFADAGNLLGYGVDIPAMFHRSAYFVDRILKGAKPADLPVEQPTRFEFVINGKTAKALGLKIPQSLLISADRVIE